MTERDDPLAKAPRLPREVREARLAAEMRANLGRRKVQARARADGAAAPDNLPDDAPAGSGGASLPDARPDARAGPGAPSGDPPAGVA